MQESSSSADSFEALPDEMMMHLFQFFSGRELQQISSVCKRFQRLSGEAIKTRIKQRAIKIIDQIREVSLVYFGTSAESSGRFDECGMFYQDWREERSCTFELIWHERCVEIAWSDKFFFDKKRGKMLVEAIYAIAVKVLKGVNKIKDETVDHCWHGGLDIWKTMYQVLNNPKTYPTTALLKKAKVDHNVYSKPFPPPGLSLKLPPPPPQGPGMFSRSTRDWEAYLNAKWSEEQTRNVPYIL